MPPMACLCVAVVGSQRTFFYPARAATGSTRHRGGKSGKPVSPARLCYTLIRAGLGRSPAEIGRMTWRQMLLFFAEVQADERAQRRARISDINAGFAGGDVAKGLYRALED